MCVESAESAYPPSQVSLSDKHVGAGNAATRWSFNNRPRDGVLAVAFVEARFWLLLGQGVPRANPRSQQGRMQRPGQTRHVLEYLEVPTRSTSLRTGPSCHFCFVLTWPALTGGSRLPIHSTPRPHSAHE